MNCHLSQVPVFALQYCCLNFCEYGLLAVVSRFERLADTMTAEVKAAAKTAAKPKAKDKARQVQCVFLTVGVPFWGHEIVHFLVATQTVSSSGHSNAAVLTRKRSASRSVVTLFFPQSNHG